MIQLLLTQAFSIPYRKGILKDAMQSTQGPFRSIPAQSTSCSSVNIPLLQNITQPPYPNLKYHFSGYLSVGANSTSALSYTFYGAQNAKSALQLASRPLILWMNGGPGSSSQLGNFFQLGRVRLKGYQGGVFQIQQNKFAWDSNFSVIFLDQPVGTGLSVNASYADNTFSVAQSSQQLYYALTQLFTKNESCFGQAFLNVSMIKAPFFIFGQSYGGKYAPAIGSLITKKTNPPMNLKGVAVGDGFTDPRALVLQMSQFAMSFSLLGYEQRPILQRAAVLCSSQIQNKKFVQARDSFYLVLDGIVQSSGDVNVYDVRKYQDNTNDTLIQSFLNNQQVMTAFGFNKNVKFSTGSDIVFEHYKNDFMRSGTDWVQDILKANISFMAYNGQVDLIVQTPGTVRWVQQLQSVGNAWKTKNLIPWRNKQNKVIGYWKDQKNLRYVMLNQAGHLVPMDQPEAALQLAEQFVQKGLSRISGE